jgi:predicted MFS family arabinose efflux permease
VAIFTLGGLVGALAANPLVKRSGRIGALRTSATSVLIGSAFTGLANTYHALLFGRYVSSTYK